MEWPQVPRELTAGLEVAFYVATQLGRRKGYLEAGGDWHDVMLDEAVEHDAADVGDWIIVVKPAEVRHGIVIACERIGANRRITYTTGPEHGSIVVHDVYGAPN